MSESSLTLESVVGRSETLLSSDLGQDVVMMDLDTGSYYGLERVAARIWALVESPTSVHSLCDQLMAEYDILPEKCHEEVLAFLGQLLEHRVIQIVS